MACCLNLCKIQEQDDILSKPLRERATTDKCCLFIMCFFAGMTFSFTIFGFLTGNPLRYVKGFDSYGNICGSNNSKLPDLPLSGQDLLNRTNVLWMIPHNFTKSPQICVSKCPDEDLKTKKDILTFYNRTNSSLCRYDFVINSDSPDPISDDLCAKPPIPKMQSVVNRCMPSYLVQSTQTLILAFYGYFADTEWIKRSIAGLVGGKHIIAIMFGSSFGFSYLMVLLLHYFAVVVAKVLIWIFLILAILITLSSWIAYFSVLFNYDSINDYVWGDRADESEDILLIFTIIITIITVFFSFTLCIMRKHIDLVVALFLETARCLKAIPCLMCSPIHTICVSVSFIAYWLVTFAFVISSSVFRQMKFMNSTGDDSTGVNTLEYDLSGGNGTEPSAYGKWVRFTLNPWVNVAIVYLVFILLWGCEFIIGCQKAVITGSVASWYFTRDRSRLSTPMLASCQIIVRKHLGTIGFGSFLIVLVILIKILVKLRIVFAGGANREKNKDIKLVLRLIDCILEKIERLVRFINYNAYTVMAIEGTNFCDSGFKAAGLMVENFTKVFTINMVGDFILWLGKMLVAILCIIVGIVLLREEDLGLLVFPLFVGFLLSYKVADSVLSVYEMIIDSLFLCYCHDKRINEGGGQFYAPPSLLSLIKKTHMENLEPYPRQSVSRGVEAKRSSSSERIRKESEGEKPPEYIKKAIEHKSIEELKKDDVIKKSEEENKPPEPAVPVQNKSKEGPKSKEDNKSEEEKVKT